MILAALVLSLFTGSSSELCMPQPLPAVEARTQQFWQEYLPRTFHQCFDRLGSAVQNAKVEMDFGPTAQIDDCREFCTVLIGDKLLNKLGQAEEVAWFLGHEAGHIALKKNGYESITIGIRLEYAADSIAARMLKHGACFGARALERLAYDQEPGDPPTIQEAMLQHRRAAMIGQCAADAVFGGR